MNAASLRQATRRYRWQIEPAFPDTGHGYAARGAARHQKNNSHKDAIKTADSWHTRFPKLFLVNDCHPTAETCLEDIKFMRIAAGLEDPSAAYALW